MKKITINLTSEQGKKFRERIEKSKERRRKKTDEMFSKIPPIHFEILKYSNNHTREETLIEYQDHSEFINKIIWHN